MLPAERGGGFGLCQVLRDGPGLVRTLSLGFLLVGPVLAELHGREHTSPGSVRRAAGTRWREMDARRKTTQTQESKTRERTRKRKEFHTPASPVLVPRYRGGQTF